MYNGAHHILAVFQRAGESNPSASTVNVWKEILEIKSSEFFYRDISAFTELVSAVASELSEIHDDADGIGRWSGTLLKALAPEHMPSDWSRFRSGFDVQSISILRGHAKILSMHGNRKGFTVEASDEAVALLQNALELVYSSDIDPKIKELVASRIEQLISLVRRHKYSCPNTVMDKAKLLAAELSVLPKEASEGLEQSGALAKVKSGIEIVANATQAASNIQSLLPFISKIALLLPK